MYIHFKKYIYNKIFIILVVNYCITNPCHSTALCVLSANPKNRTCLCADNQMEVSTLTVSNIINLIYKKYSLNHFYL